MEVLVFEADGGSLFFEKVERALSDLRLGEVSLTKADPSVNVDIRLPALRIDLHTLPCSYEMEIWEIKALISKFCDSLSCPCGANDFCRCE